MLRSTTLRTAALACTASLFAGCGGGPTLQETSRTDDAVVVAEYAGERLTLDAFEAVYARTSGGRMESADDSLGAYQDFLRRYVDFRLKVTQAEALGYDEDSTLIAEMEDYREQLARPYFLDRTVLEEIVREIYERQQVEVSASHILVRLAPEADSTEAYALISSLRDSVLAGADFNELARSESQDPSAAQNAGQLGYFSGGRMIEAFETRAYSTPIGEVSEPFRTRFGYHILRVEDRRQARPEIRARHILIRPQEGDTAAARQTALDLLARVESGEDFAALAEEFSDDTASGAQGGDLGYFGSGRMVPPFDAAAFALVDEGVGALSPVVETRFGYHVIKLEDVRERPTYEESFNELKRTAERLPRTARKRQELGKELRQQPGNTFDEAMVRRGIDRFAPDSVTFGLMREGFGLQSDSVFATIGDRTYTLGEAAGIITRSAPRPGLTQTQNALEALNEFLNEEAVTVAALDLERTDPEFRQLIEDYSDGVLLFAISEDSVWTRAATDTAGLQAFYQDNIASYSYPERRRVIVYSSRRDSVLVEADAALAAGASPMDVADRFNETPETSVQIDTVYVDAPREEGDLYNEVFTMSPGERIGPAAYRNSRVILVLDGIEAPRSMTFDEARAQASADYQDALEEAWLEQLRDTYGARLYPARLAAAFASERAEMEAASAADSVQEEEPSATE